MRKYLEMQGHEFIPEDTEDEIWERNEEGELVKVEVADDAGDD